MLYYHQLLPPTHLRGLMFASALQCPSFGIQDLVNAEDFIQEQHLTQHLCWLKHANPSYDFHVRWGDAWVNSGRPRGCLPKGCSRKLDHCWSQKERRRGRVRRQREDKSLKLSVATCRRFLLSVLYISVPQRRTKEMFRAHLCIAGSSIILRRRSKYSSK